MAKARPYQYRKFGRSHHKTWLDESSRILEIRGENMNIKDFCEAIDAEDSSFFGVPDSQLKALCDYLIDEYGISERHSIAANEGNCTAMAAGYYMATGKIPVVYMQNSGIGNIINPVASLLNDNVYGIPCKFIVGWRGEPGVHDEPQHVFQGQVTVSLLEHMNICTYVVEKDTTKEELGEFLKGQKAALSEGRSIAFVIRNGSLTYDKKVNYANSYAMVREEVIGHIVEAAKEDLIVSTTGKISRELFEIRERNDQSHKYDFLTVGSMGHSSSIALEIARVKENKTIWCIDGDGAALMHMGAMAVIGSEQPHNLIHIVINNGAHETVGGMPTVVSKIDLCGIAKCCGYKKVSKATSYEELKEALNSAKEAGVLCFIEVCTAIGSRVDLGRPTTTPKENIKNFMDYLQK